MFQDIKDESKKTKQLEDKRERSEFVYRSITHAARAKQAKSDGAWRQSFLIARQARLEARIVVEDPAFGPAINGLSHEWREQLEDLYRDSLARHHGARESDFQPVDVPIDQATLSPADRTPEALAATVENGEREFLGRDAELPEHYLQQQRQEGRWLEGRQVNGREQEGQEVRPGPAVEEQRDPDRLDQPGLADGVGEIDAFAKVEDDAGKKPEKAQEQSHGDTPDLGSRIVSGGSNEPQHPAAVQDKDEGPKPHEYADLQWSDQWGNEHGKPRPLYLYAKEREKLRGSEQEDEKLLGLAAYAIDTKDRAAFGYMVSEISNRGEDARQRFNLLIASRTGNRDAGRELILEEQHKTAVMERLNFGFHEIDKLQRQAAEGRGDHRERLNELHRSVKLDAKTAIEDERMSSHILGSEHRERIERVYQEPVGEIDRRQGSDIPVAVLALRPEHRSPNFNVQIAKQQEDRFLAERNTLPADYLDRRQESGPALQQAADLDRDRRERHEITTAVGMKIAIDNLKDGKIPPAEIEHARAGIAAGHEKLSRENSYHGAAYRSGQAAATRLSAATVTEQVKRSKQPPQQQAQERQEELPPPTATKAAMQEFRRELLMTR